MSFSDLGLEIKNLRKNRGFSQKELSNGICSQAQISKIEKGDVYPLATTLYELSARLGVDINFFFERVLVERLDYVEEVYNQIRQAIDEYDYQMVNDIVNTEKKNPLYNNYLEFRQFIMWHDGICRFHLETNVDEAIKLIDQAFELTHTQKYYSEREIELINSKAVIYLLIKDYHLAIELYETLLHEHSNLKNEKDPRIKIRLYYNLSQALNRNKEYEQSIRISEEGIRYCVSKSNMYLFGHLYFQMGINYYKLERNEKALYHFEKAHTLFDLQHNTIFKNHIENNFFTKLKTAAIN